jgi:predicted Zn-dependent protease
MIEGHERTILAAHGYTELSMFDDALAELETLPPETAGHADVVELRARILMQAKRWKPALEASRRFCVLQPGQTDGYINVAFCLHALGRTEEAREVLLSGPEALRAEPTFHYNLACYECVLGHLDLARMHLEKSIQLDKKYRDFAKGDSDLAALHE